MGGFTSTAPVLAGKLRGVPTFIHESNAIPGKANKLTARLVRAVLLGFKECAPFFPKVKTIFGKSEMNLLLIIKTKKEKLENMIKKKIK